MSKLTVAICTYNRAERLPKLIAALRQQRCCIPFEILVINNNSSDRTSEVLAALATEAGVSLRHVMETQQGIVFARNRAIDESSASDYLVFIDDDELPLTDFLQNAVTAFQQEGADCVGGPIRVRFVSGQRPDWLSDSLLGFLGELDHGREPLWIADFSTPLWNGSWWKSARRCRSSASPCILIRASWWPLAPPIRRYVRWAQRVICPAPSTRRTVAASTPGVRSPRRFALRKRPCCGKSAPAIRGAAITSRTSWASTRRSRFTPVPKPNHLPFFRFLKTGQVALGVGTHWISLRATKIVSVAHSGITAALSLMRW